MHKVSLFLLLSIFAFQISAQNIYHRVRVDLVNKDIKNLAALGIETDHGKMAKGRYLENDFSEKELQLIKDAGFSTKIIIKDVSTYYEKQMADDLSKTPLDCINEDPFKNYETPDHFVLGSMSGYYTYQEMLDILSDMQSEYPELISVKKEISSTYTHEDRPIYSVVISDNPDDDELEEPKTLYTALHHSREPGSLSQMIYFMWYMLENYETNSVIKSIIDNTQLHFIPCVNPDGYIFNETNFPNGGGLWRKNRRDNEDGTYGVDLNRNYGFEWAHDDIGSSDNPESEVYRGPSAFSEPEIQNVKTYCEEHNFKFILNYHTFGNLMIYPWAYSDAPTPEHPYFVAIAKEITKLNDYFAGSTTETVGYAVNGDTDDWMYGEQTTKEKAYALTPEVGLQGFWPPISNIISDCQENIQANISFAAFNLNFPVIEFSEPELVSTFEGTIDYTVTQLGLDSEEFSVSISAGENISITDDANYNFETLDSETKTISFSLNEDIENLENYSIIYTIETNSYTKSDTLNFIFDGNVIKNEIGYEEFGNGAFWEADDVDWFYTEEHFTSPEVSLTESPNSNYSNQQYKIIYSKDILLPESDYLELQFNLKVDIEKSYDYAQLFIIDEDNTLHELCGKYSSIGTVDQAFEKPLYDGEFDWVTETIDISEWNNQNVSFAWSFTSDAFVTGDGFYVDDWSIYDLQNIVGIQNYSKTHKRIYPNPGSNYFKIDESPININRVQMFDSMGKLVFEKNKTNTIPTQTLQSGPYHITIFYNNGSSQHSTVIIQK